ncbi:MAG TPA: helix-turn-helix domain-containing protein [Acidimicrobiales bacterium]|jgi:AcrR family transcriptional regulator
MVQEVANEGTSTRHRILQIALTLMSERGVDATSMRDLASAAGLNVASLYHYFPSKRELLEAVLIERGFLPVRAALPKTEGDLTDETALADMLTVILVSVFEVREFVRLMLGEAIRYEETARTVGMDLFRPFQISIEDWIVKHRPDLAERLGAAPVARLLSAMVVGIFVEHEAGVLADEGDDLEVILGNRAREAAQIVGSTF